MKIIVIVVLAFVQHLFAQDVYLKLTTGQRKKVNIAISFQSEELKAIADEMKKVIKEDLIFSLYFDNIMDTTITDEKTIFPSLASEGVSAFIKAEVAIKKGDTIATVEIYDVYIRRKISGEKYIVHQPTIRRTCHRISDAIIKALTGENGISQTRIALSFKQGMDKKICIVDYDGQGFDQITTGKGLHLSPRWIPNSDAITYVAYKEEDMWIYRFDIYTGKLDILSQERGMNIGAAWSPTAKEFALILTKDGNPEIYTKSGNKIQRLTVDRAIESSPTWSPNGREICFVSDRSGGPQIYIMSKDGTNVRRLTFRGGYNTSPVWSPKGDRIAYVAREVDGTFQVHSILVGGEGDSYLTFEDNNEDPSWSPDGLHLCFVSDRKGRSELFTMHWDGSGQKKIASAGDGCYTPSWSY
ncbi:MAG: PD40 domain-containing protein [Candidatus Stahlbacteria bacterium]|nr:PD40 domain-containing protein [Candidatus Stahlbacteria bacterium]